MSRHLAYMPMAAACTCGVAETAMRVRGRIETILNFAKANGHWSGENPARWKGHLDQLLPASSKIRTVRSHASLPFPELPDFMIKLQGQHGITAKALMVKILTVPRNSDILGSRWPEVDFNARVHTIPAGRVKGRDRDQRIPLSTQALALYENLKAEAGISSEFVFPSPDKPGQPLSDGAFRALLDRMGYGHVTPHGFRATFKTWASEMTKAATTTVDDRFSLEHFHPKPIRLGGFPRASNTDSLPLSLPEGQGHGRAIQHRSSHTGCSGD